jgi:hypothetical protein
MFFRRLRLIATVSNKKYYEYIVNSDVLQYSVNNV